MWYRHFESYGLPVPRTTGGADHDEQNAVQVPVARMIVPPVFWTNSKPFANAPRLRRGHTAQRLLLMALAIRAPAPALALLVARNRPTVPLVPRPLFAVRWQFPDAVSYRRRYYNL
jgi:hypothetical protein